MTIEEIVQQSRDLLDLLPAQALAQARQRHPDIGGFAVFPVYAPVEIIHAAGLMPVGLFGAGGKVELSHAESRFPDSTNKVLAWKSLGDEVMRKMLWDNATRCFGEP